MLMPAASQSILTKLRRLAMLIVGLTPLQAELTAVPSLWKNQTDQALVATQLPRFYQADEAAASFWSERQANLSQCLIGFAVLRHPGCHF